MLSFGRIPLFHSNVCCHWAASGRRGRQDMTAACSTSLLVRETSVETFAFSASAYVPSLDIT
jgi:hypothetical protein